MNLLKQLSGIFKKPTLKEGKERRRELLLKKFQSFQELLSHNNQVLELMADMEEKLSGEFLFDRHYISQRITDIAEGVKIIIDSLNEISGNKYSILHKRFHGIVANIEKLLTMKREIPPSSYTIPYDEITKEMSDIVGNKNANLGEVRNLLRILTPDGFAISAFAFKQFVEHNKLLEKIKKVLSELKVDTLEVLNSKSYEIQDEIIKAEIHHDLEKEISDAYAQLCARSGNEVKVSVRSSALLEDGEFSFAGQYATFLNIPPDLILRKYKEVIASLFTPRAIFYYKTKGLQEYEMVMSVGVLAMIDAKAAGVIYSRDPNNPGKNTLIISAARGLGKSVVDGVVTPETYTLSRNNLEVISRNIPEQKSMFVCKPDGEIGEVILTDDLKGTHSLRDEQIKILAEYAIVIENHFKAPQDIEWAIDQDDRVYILQTRPLIILKEKAKPVPTRIEGYHILIDRGVIACKGIGFGRAYIIRTEEDLKGFPDGAILVAKHTSTKYVTVMNKAKAIITDVGGAAGHMASLAREFQVPTILDTEMATNILKDGQELTVDAINCNIYDGHVRELQEFVEKREETFKSTRIFQTYEKVLKWVVPLKVLYPDDPKFLPEFCETFHDITRFAHQKAMQEMFHISAELPEGVDMMSLAAGIPLIIHIIDLGSCIEGSPKKLTPAHISSIPFNAFLKGLVALQWPEPRHLGVKSFLGMVAHTAEIPEVELERMGEESFSFISKEYMNFSIRLGYHLSVVEAYTGENINDNYIRFFFKGGGASRERRLRRVSLMSEILKKIDFRVKVTEDVIDAVITKHKKPQLEEKLGILGRLTVYTKQLDAVMHDDTSTELYMEDFIREHLKNIVQSDISSYS